MGRIVYNVLLCRIQARFVPFLYNTVNENIDYVMI